MGGKLEKATKKLGEAADAVTLWEGKTEELEADLSHAQASSGPSAFETGDVEGVAARISSLRDQVEKAKATVEAAKAASFEAACAAWTAESEELDEQAAKLEKKSEKHAARTNELLAELEAHEGGPYEPLQPPQDMGTASDLKPWTPKSVQMTVQALACRRKADNLRMRAANATQAEAEDAGRVGRVEAGVA